MNASRGLYFKMSVFMKRKKCLQAKTIELRQAHSGMIGKQPVSPTPWQDYQLGNSPGDPRFLASEGNQASLSGVTTHTTHTTLTFHHAHHTPNTSVATNSVQGPHDTHANEAHNHHRFQATVDKGIHKNLNFGNFQFGGTRLNFPL